MYIPGVEGGIQVKITLNVINPDKVNKLDFCGMGRYCQAGGLPLDIEANQDGSELASWELVVQFEPKIHVGYKNHTNR